MAQSPAGPELVLDINAVPTQANPPSSPDGFVRLGTTILCAASADGLGRELWAIDAGASEARLVADLWPGPASGAPLWITVHAGAVWFSADDGTHGRELWRSDGTPAGTALVADLEPGSASGAPRDLLPLGDWLVFGAATSATGDELWRSDGTAAGTAPIVDLVPGPQGSGPGYFAPSGGELWFRARTPAGLDGIYATDGTAAGTRLVHTFGSIEALAWANRWLLIAADDGTHGVELWRSDGTPGSAMLVFDCNPGAAHARPDDITTFAGGAVFVADDGVHGREPWVTDGTPTGTRLLADVRPGPAAADARLPIAVGARVVFVADDGTHGREPWVTDGTPSYTGLLADLAPGPTSGGPVDRPALLADGRAIFRGYHPSEGYEPWVTDGTGAGTALLDAVRPGNLSSGAWAFTRVGDVVAFAADDGVHGSEPWVTDGTLPNTRLLVDLYRPAPPTGDGAVDRLVDVDGVAWFAASDGVHGVEPWRSDGTAAGTWMIADLAPGAADSDPANFAVVGRRVFFDARLTSTTWWLWCSDGTPAGTIPLRAIGSSPRSLLGVALGDRYVFPAYDNGTGVELYVSDGTPAGTTLLVDLLPGAAGFVSSLVRVGSLAFGVGSDRQLHVSDGTAAGTATVPRNLGGSFHALAACRGRAVVSTGDHGELLWASDGSAADTVLIRSFAIGSGQLVASQGRVFLQAADGASGYELWVTDGSAAGTSSLAAISPLASAAVDRPLAAFRAGVLFQGRTATTGTEPWFSDGTPAGTVALGDLEPGATGSVPYAFTAAGTRHAYFSAWTSAVGRELWETDGTAAGTRLVADLRPGSETLGPRALVHSGGRLLFAADDGVHGYEPWRLDVGASAQCMGVGHGNSTPPTLRADDPVLGTLGWLRLGDVPPRCVGLVMLGLRSPRIELGSTLEIWVDLGQGIVLVDVATPPAGGGALLPLPIPNDPVLAGLPLAAQALYGPTGRPPLAIDASNGAWLWLGR
ncbi:MAG: hypothetical protein IPM29_30110 [Planctomycetes bacterium]|nr:hypothetical protein [Planctomycetota bacterium]